MARPKKSTVRGKWKKRAARSSTNKQASTKLASKKRTSQKRTASAPAIRRPDPNLPPSPGTVNEITDTILNLIQELEGYTANLRALDRQRHNGVGLKRLGFIEAAFRLSSKFPQYFPPTGSAQQSFRPTSTCSTPYVPLSKCAEASKKKRGTSTSKAPT